MLSNFTLEVVLLFFVLGLQRNDLDSRVFSDATNLLVVPVLFLCTTLDLLDLLAQATALVLAARELLAQHIDLTSQLLVVCLGLIQQNALIREDGVVSLQRDLLLLLLLGRGFLGLDVLLALRELLLSLSNLLLDDDELTLFVLESLRELVDLTLKTVRLGLEVGAHGTVTASRHG